MKRNIVVAAVFLFCAGCAGPGMYSNGSRGNMVITHEPGLAESLAAVPVAVLTGVARGLTGFTRVETPEQYATRIEAEKTAAENAAASATVVYYYQPYYGACPYFSPGVGYVYCYYTPGWVWFVGGDGYKYRHPWKGRGRHRRHR